ncbi:MAG: hypothetical protein ACE5K3_00965 [bacterium]
MREKVKEQGGEHNILKTLVNRKILPIDRRTFDRLLQLTSGQIYDPLIQESPDGTYTVKYTKKTGRDEIRFIFPNLDEKDFKWIVRKRKITTKRGKKEIKEILNFDDLARRVLLIELFFAWGVGSPYFVYRPWDMLYWLDMSDRKKGILRDRVTSISHALALATVIIKNEGGDETKITHLMSLADKGKGRNRVFEVFLYEDAMMPLWPKLMKELKKEGKLPPYVRYPVPGLAYNPKQSKYVQNFIHWAIKQEGMGKKFYPMKVETVLIEAMRMTPEKIRHDTKKKLEDVLYQGLIEGKKDKVITGWDIANTKKVFKPEFLKSKIKIYFPTRQPQLFKLLGTIDKEVLKDKPEDIQIIEIADWLHEEEFQTKRAYKTTVKMLKQVRKQLGGEKLQEIFKWVTEDSNNPHPKKFWEEIEDELSTD